MSYNYVMSRVASASLNLVKLVDQFIFAPVFSMDLAEPDDNIANIRLINPDNSTSG